jgi:cyclophilin family peptidyl-prolyl cis-trans isomerase
MGTSWTNWLARWRRRRSRASGPRGRRPAWPRACPRLVELEPRTTPASLAGDLLANILTAASASAAAGVFPGGVSVAVGDVDGDKFPDIVVGAGPGGGPHVRVLSGKTGQEELGFMAFDPRFAGGVNVAVGDVNGDGKADIIVGAGLGGGPEVSVFDGTSGALITTFMAYDTRFAGGVNVAAADVDGDGKADIITGAGLFGGPQVKVFSGADGHLISTFMAYDSRFNGGVSVAAGDVNGDGKAEIVTGAGLFGGPHVKVFSPDGTEQAGYMAFDPRFNGGVHVAVGDVNGDGKGDLIVGAGPFGGPEVTVLDAATGAPIESYMAFDPRFFGGVNVAAGDLNGDGKADIVAGAGPLGGPDVRAVSGADLAPITEFSAFPPFIGPPGPFSTPADQVPPTLTLQSPPSGQTDTTNPTITGTVNDNVGLAAVEASIDNAAFTDVVSKPANGTFTFTTGLATDGTADGAHTVQLRARDLAGNHSAAQTFTFTLKTQVAQPVFNLDPASDTGPAGDQRTADATVTLDGQTDAGATVTLASTGQTATADGSGKFALTGVALAPGPNSLTVKASDSLGNTSSFTRTITLDRAPTVSSQIGDVSVAQNAAPTEFNLAKSFADADVSNSTVRLDTSAGPINLELFDQETPLTVNNFLSYLNSGRYTDTVFHRSVPGFVLQGGGFVFNSNPARLDAVVTDNPVQNEPGISNTRGTVAMAKLGGDPNSATSQFFFSLADNSSTLDSQNGGFTVFAKVADDASQAVVDQLAAIPTQNRASNSNPSTSAFTNLPLQNYPQPPNGNFPTDTTLANYAALNAATVLTRSDQLTFTATSSNTGLVTPAVVGNALTLTYTAGQTGSATITVKATDQDGASVTQTFKVTVS